MNVRRDDRLSNLEPAARAKLDGWLKSHTYREVVSLAAAPPPDGLGLRTNLRALSAYYKKYLAPSPLDRLVKLAESNPAAAQNAATALLHAQALQAASTPDIDLRTFNVLVRFHGQNVREHQDQRRAALQQKEIALREARQRPERP